MSNTHPLISLLTKDQNNISLFKGGEITIDEYKKTATEVEAEFSDYIKNYGFPFKNKFGQNIYKAAIVLALHTHEEFMSSVFVTIRNATYEEVEGKDKAYFTDRLLTFKGRPQIYGTQFKRTESGSMEPFPIDDPGNVDTRRKNIGLEPLEEYKKKILNNK